jgi:hypothetical protein
MRSKGCKDSGFCSSDGQDCVALADADCVDSLACTENGRCRAVDGACVAEPVEIPAPSSRPTRPDPPPPAPAPPAPAPAGPRIVDLAAPQVSGPEPVPSPGGGVLAGYRLTPRGRLLGAGGRRAEVVVRFGLRGAGPLRASPYNLFNDGGGQVAARTGEVPVENDAARLASVTLSIPTLNLDLAPTNGARRYEVEARASVYVDGELLGTSEPARFSVQW